MARSGAAGRTPIGRSGARSIATPRMSGRWHGSRPFCPLFWRVVLRPRPGDRRHLTAVVLARVGDLDCRPFTPHMFEPVAAWPSRLVSSRQLRTTRCMPELSAIVLARCASARASSRSPGPAFSVEQRFCQSDAPRAIQGGAWRALVSQALAKEVDGVVETSECVLAPAEPERDRTPIHEPATDDLQVSRWAGGDHGRPRPFRMTTQRSGRLRAPRRCRSRSSRVAARSREGDKESRSPGPGRGDGEAVGECDGDLPHRLARHREARRDEIRKERIESRCDLTEEQATADVDRPCKAGSADGAR